MEQSLADRNPPIVQFGLTTDSALRDADRQLKVQRMNHVVMAASVVMSIVWSGAAASAQSADTRARTEIRSPSGHLVCSKDAYMKYFAQVAAVGRMGLPFNETLPDRSAIMRLLVAYEALRLSGPRTMLVAGHYPSGALYHQTCASERCTLEEMAQPMSACLTRHFNHCSYIAVRFRGVDYCLVGEASD
jgi:hypothetical protein